MIRRPTISTRTDTLVPYKTLVRSRPRIAAVVQPHAVLRPPICVFIFRHYLIPVASSPYRCDESVKRQPHARRFSAGKAHLLAGRGFLRRRGACALSRAYTAFSPRQGGGRNRAGRAGRREHGRASGRERVCQYG